MFPKLLLKSYTMEYDPAIKMNQWLQTLTPMNTKHIN